jgi:hypothetical protein
MSALRGSIGRIDPSGATAGAAVGADAEPPVAADVVEAAGVVVRIVSGVFRAGLETGRDVFVDGGAAAAGLDDGPCAGGEASPGGGGAAAAGTDAAGLAPGVAIAFTALRQSADNLASLRKRHSSASLPPGCTLAQFAMKSERQEARTASRCAWVGCCAAAAASVSGMRQPATSEDLNIEPSLAFSDNATMLAIAPHVQQGEGGFLPRPLFAAAVGSAS